MVAIAEHISARDVLTTYNKSANKHIHTIVAEYPLWIHNELMTHRVFARSAASSRAIPYKRMREYARFRPAHPIVWTLEQAGMQGKVLSEAGPKIAHPKNTNLVVPPEQIYDAALDAVLPYSDALVNAGYHKQHANRLLGPWLKIRTLITATKWGNFLRLRDHKDAEPHMQLLAQAVDGALALGLANVKEPVYGWHMPYIDHEDMFIKGESVDANDLRVLSVARCASVSYMTVDGLPMTRERAENVYRKLLGNPMHAAPFEHVAKPSELKARVVGSDVYRPVEWGPFDNWVPYRHTLDGGDVG